jgi:hypothetical protein
MRRIVLTSLLGVLSLVLLGCPARWEVVFINGAKQPLLVRVSGALDGRQSAFKLAQGASHSELLEHVQRLEVADASGALLLQRDDFRTRDLGQSLQGKYPQVYVLLTATNIYLVPPDYSRTWREHIDEITRRKT